MLIKEVDTVQPEAYHFQCMASPCEVQCPAAEEAQKTEIYQLVEQEARRIEQKFSRYRNDNLVARINAANGWVETDSEMERLLDFAEACYQLSDGTFDITSGVLRKVWCFDGSDRVPSQSAVAEILAYTGWKKVQRKSGAIKLEPGMEIDFGGIGKEYAVDRCFDLVSELAGPELLINFGGDLRAKSRAAGWQVGIESLEGEGAEEIVRIHRGALATSGDSRRYLLRDGKRYSHVLDARTGWPVDQAPRSMTVYASTCIEAGILATLSLMKGLDAEAFLREQDVQFWCLRGGQQPGEAACD